ncbi:hypothetical protein TRFO_38184 [Tritrichomonas foetus]|uniref:Uncharacterized protein n=1 Tax=Tritrichomonas foetus TaxID=1144522 RepID=A0A1J4JE12_9EUKA|nr:hypothetical protein TRFO_38184 [Tritrichomonas foetus]|eukprot:OHS95677.1 hypothetical protein TRFO_38184 [Tritrichomonas foetus]
MQTKIDPTHFFVPPEAWDKVKHIEKVDPIKKFNSLKAKTKFTKPINSSQLNDFFSELILNIKQEKFQFVDSFVNGFISILLNNIDLDSSIFNLSKWIFQYIYQKVENQITKFPSILIIVAIFDLLQSNLPLSVSFEHLCNLQEEYARILHKYVGDPNNEYSIATKCLAVSLCFPSTRFVFKSNSDENDQSSSQNSLNEIKHKNRENFNHRRGRKPKKSDRILKNESKKFENGKIPFIEPENVNFLPDPTIMLDKSEYFNDTELFYACFIVQYANALFFSIGSQQNDITFKQCYEFQHLLTYNELSLGSICHSISIHTSQPTTLPFVQHFFKNMNNLCGIELIKELFILNTTNSYKIMMKTFGLTPISLLFEKEEQFKKSFINLIRPFHLTISNLEATISHLADMSKNDEDKQKVLPFLGSLYSTLLKFSISSLYSIYNVIMNHFLEIVLIFHTFFEKLTLQPQLEKTEITHLSVCILTLIFELLNRLNLKSLSNKIIMGSLDSIYYLMHVQVLYENRSHTKNFYYFLLFDVEKAFQEIGSFFVSHQNIYCKYFDLALPDFLLPSVAVFGSVAYLKCSTLIKLVEYCIFSYEPQVFISTKNAILFNIAHNINNISDDNRNNSVNFNGNELNNDDKDIANHGFEVIVFYKKFCDLYFTLMSNIFFQSNSNESILNENANANDLPTVSVLEHAQKLYLLLLCECLKNSEEFTMFFVGHPLFEQIYQFSIQSITEHQMDSFDICPYLEILESLWKYNSPKIQNKLEGFDLSNLFLNIRYFDPYIANSVLRLSVRIGRKYGKFPCEINKNDFKYYPADNLSWFIKILAKEFPNVLSSNDLNQTNENDFISSILNFNEENENDNEEENEEESYFSLPWLEDYLYNFILIDKSVIIRKTPTYVSSSHIINEEEEEEEEEKHEKEIEESDF